jgi:hypothetical protein
MKQADDYGNVDGLFWRLGVVKDLKKLKTKMSMAFFAHSRAKFDAAGISLCQWFYEACVSVAITKTEHHAVVDLCNTLGFKQRSLETDHATRCGVSAMPQ